MVRHIVMWVLKEELGGETKEQVMGKIKKDLEALKKVRPEIVEIQVAFNINPAEKYDLVLNSLFHTLEDVKTYAVSPEHTEVAAYIKGKAAVRSAIDFEVE